MNDTCTRCNRTVPSYDGVFQSDGRGNSLGFVCGRCWTGLISERAGEEIAHLEIEPVIMHDAEGVEHEFHFRFNPLPRNLEAFELVDGAPGGYQFQVIEDDDPRILERLLEKMRGGLSQQHLKPSELGGLAIKDFLVRGRFEWDEEEGGEIPAVVIDGKRLSWWDLGAMLMAFEGWQFRMEVLDLSEDM